MAPSAATAVTVTREMLEAGALDQMVAAASPTMRILSDAERAESLAATLAARPAGAGGVWLFAYGSLIWNPALHFTEQRLARIHGWHRAFCLSTSAGRGTPQLPGLVLGLDRGGACTGAAFHVAEALVEAELALLWRREMLAGSYCPRWVTVRGADGVPFGAAIAFTIRRDAPQYTRMERAALIERLATARGALGSSAEYLFKTRDGLRGLGIRDQRVEALAAAVELHPGLAADEAGVDKAGADKAGADEASAGR